MTALKNLAAEARTEPVGQKTAAEATSDVKDKKQRKHHVERSHLNVQVMITDTQSKLT